MTKLLNRRSISALIVATLVGIGVLTSLQESAATPTSSSDLFSATGSRIEDGATLTNAGLLPLTVKPRVGDPESVKFVLDGSYLGSDTSAPYQPVISALAAGEHKLRYTVKRSTADPVEATIEFAVGSTGSSAPSTSAPAPASSTPVPAKTSSPAAPASTPAALPPAQGTSITVTNAVTLQNALDSAVAGMTITLADGVYSGKDVKNPSGKEPGRFVISRSGTAAAPITLRGTRQALLDGGGTGGGYAIHLTNARYWNLTGFTVQSAAKGIVLDGSSNNVLDTLHVTGIGQEGIHFRSYSSDNILRNSIVDNTGITSPNYGEGVYLGSAVSNWPTYTGGLPDRSDRNQVLNNRIVDTAAENIDIKEGTTGGVIRGNYFGGDKIASKNSADSWIDVKGNNYVIESNHGVTAAKPQTTQCGDPKGDASSTKNPFCDGFQVHVQVDGWGENNVFTKNILEVNAPGVGILLQNTALNKGNVIKCDNVVTGAKSGNYAYNHYVALPCTP
jgi:parallel beta-helix repeat protein